MNVRDSIGQQLVSSVYTSSCRRSEVARPPSGGRQLATAGLGARLARQERLVSRNMNGTSEYNILQQGNTI